MNIYDMFLENKNTLLAKGFALTDFPVEQDTSRYLLYELASGKLQQLPAISINTKSYPVYGLLHITEGTALYRTQPHSQAALTLDSSSILLFDCRTPHTLSFKTDCYCELIYFDGYPAAYYCSRLLKEDTHLQTDCTTELSLKFQTLLDTSPEDSMQTHLLLTDLLTRLVQNNTPATVRVPTYLLQIKDLLDTTYYTSHTLEELETEYKTDRYRICREFKTHFHTSPMQYLHQVRMQNAQLLLREKNMKVHEIAYEVGYENVNHFIHHFKKTTGSTPAEYRKNLITL